MPYVQPKPNGGLQLLKAEAFVHFTGGEIPRGGSIKEIFDGWDAAIRDAHDEITGGALSNAHGDWYEWLIAICAWNRFVEGDGDFIVALPNISQYDVARLYDDRLFNLIEDLRAKVSAGNEVELISSNPDFVIISRELALRALPDPPERINRFGEGELRFLNSVYERLSGLCGYEDILGYISVKLSLRPDRRLQIAHEGSLVKAIYVHLQTRLWELSPKGIGYFAVSASMNDADVSALRTVATHSITTVNSDPQSAVDELFEADSILAINQALDGINNHLHPE